MSQKILNPNFNHSSLRFYFVFFLAVLSIRVWSLKIIPDGLYDLLELVAALILIIDILLNLSTLKKLNYSFKNNVIIFLTIPILSSICALTYHNQPIEISLILLRRNFFWLLYFTIILYNIEPHKILNILLYIGGMWILINIVQQLTYPNYIFYSRNEEGGNTILRAGIYRYMIQGNLYGFFFVIYHYQKYLFSKKKIRLLYVAFGLLGFYFYGTRQYAVSAIICILICNFISNQKTLWPIVLSILLTSIIYMAKDILFAEYIKMTKDQISEDDIRVLAAEFFLFEYWPHWVTYILGNGAESVNSPYGLEIVEIENTFHLYRSDVGIIGALNKFGLFYSLNIISFCLTGFSNKRYIGVSRYLKTIFINSALLLPLSESFSEGPGIVFFCLVLHIIDRFDFAKNAKPIYAQKETEL